MKTRQWPMILLFALQVCFAEAQSTETNQINPDSVRKWLSKSHVPAVGFAVIENGALKEVTVLGTLDGKNTAPPETVFNVASLTKPVAALVAVKLVAEGKLSLDEPLSKYWIDPDLANDRRYEKITTRLVLSHQTGFPNWRWNNGGVMLTFQFEPGKAFQYSGEGYEYLRKALEHKFKKRFAEIARTELFDPLKLNNMFFTWDPALQTRFALWHDRGGANTYPIRKTVEDCAADDLMTTVGDYATFAAYVLNGAGLPPALYTDMVTPQVAIKPHVDYGLGWQIVKDLPEKEYALVHTGADDGVRAAVILLPNSKRGVVILTNGDNGMEIVKRMTTVTLDVGAQIIEYLK